MGQHLFEELPGFFRREHEILPAQQMNFRPFVLLIDKDRADMLRTKKPGPGSVRIIQLDEIAYSHLYLAAPSRMIARSVGSHTTAESFRDSLILC